MIIDDEILKKHGVMFAVIYAVVSNNPNVTQAEIATLCHTSLRTVQRTLDELQQLRYIEIKVNKPNPNTYQVLHTTATPPTLTYGEFGLVRLTEPELKKLQKKYPKIVIDDYIQRIDTYLYNNKAHKINTYPTHYATIKLWVDGDVRQNGGYITHRKTKTMDELRENEETMETINRIMQLNEKSISNRDDKYKPSVAEIESFYGVSSRQFWLHENVHDEIVALFRPSKINVPREMCFGIASREYLEKLQLTIAPNTPRGSWGILTTDAMYYVEQYRKYYTYLDNLKEKAKNKSQDFLDYVGYHEGDE